MNEFLHISKPQQSSPTIFLFLVPILVFISLVVVLLNKTTNTTKQAYTSSTSQAVLGEETSVK